MDRDLRNCHNTRLVPYTHRLITRLIISLGTSTLQEKCAGCVSPMDIKIKTSLRILPAN